MYYERVRLGHPDYEHGCCRVTPGPDGDPWRCGQFCGHDSDCTWWTPGGYLPPRLITALDWFDAGWRGRMPGRSFCCPICRLRVDTAYGYPGITVYGDAENAERDEIRWEFRPCGCEGREIAG